MLGCIGLTLNHVHVVGSISNGQRDGLLVPLHQVHYHGLLLGSDAAADDSATLTGQVHKILLPLFFLRLEPSLTLGPHPSLFFCLWELELQNVSFLGLFFQENFIL